MVKITTYNCEKQHDKEKNMIVFKPLKDNYKIKIEHDDKFSFYLKTKNNLKFDNCESSQIDDKKYIIANKKIELYENGESKKKSILVQRLKIHKEKTENFSISIILICYDLRKSIEKIKMLKHNNYLSELIIVDNILNDELDKFFDIGKNILYKNVEKKTLNKVIDKLIKKINSSHIFIVQDNIKITNENIYNLIDVFIKDNTLFCGNPLIFTNQSIDICEHYKVNMMYELPNININIINISCIIINKNILLKNNIFDDNYFKNNNTCEKYISVSNNHNILVSSSFCFEEENNNDYFTSEQTLLMKYIYSCYEKKFDIFFQNVEFCVMYTKYVEDQAEQIKKIFNYYKYWNISNRITFFK
jgi:hypothetical protein